mmetsp:Transcript_32052/g.63180  ORF Transcript_32052/g.63180 Transcript_32052/m.63180 type:complete len:225 (+) Transcript_32052:954-1628(+)
MGSTPKNSGIVPMWQFIRLAKVQHQRRQRLAVPQHQLQVLARNYGGSAVVKGFLDIHAVSQAACATSKVNITANVYPVWRRHGPHHGQLRPQPQANQHLHHLQDQEEAFALVQKTRHGMAVSGALLQVPVAFALKILEATIHTSLLGEALVKGVAGVAQGRAILANTLSLSKMDGRSLLIRHQQQARTPTAPLHTCSFAMESSTASAGPTKTRSACRSLSRQRA